MKKKKLKGNVKKVRNVFAYILILSITFIIGFFIQRKINFVNEYVDVVYDTVDTKVINKASLVMVGDSLIHSSVYNAYKSGSGYNFTKMFTYIKPIVEEYDLAYYNQETILGGTSLGLRTYPQFNSPQEVGDAFMDAGFNLVSLATNHTMDNYYTSVGKNGKAISASRTYWNKQEEEKGIIASGSYTSEEERKKEKIGEKNGLKYALLSYTTSTNGITVPSGKSYLVNTYSEAKVKEEVDYYKDKVDVIMVAMHWGEEYTHYPVNSQKNIAKYLNSIGVNIIIGCHPHVLEPITFVGDTLVVYSLGNFVSSQGTSSTAGLSSLVGLMASCDIVKTTYHGKTTLTIENVMGDLIYTDKANKGGKGRFVVYPFKNLTNNILSNYKSQYTKFGKIVTAYSDRVTMKGL